MSRNHSDNKIRLWELYVAEQPGAYLYLLTQNDKRTIATRDIDWLFKYATFDYDMVFKSYGEVIAEGDSRDCLAKQHPELFL